MLQKLLLLITVLNCYSFSTTAQISWDRTYPLLAEQRIAPLFLQEATNQLLVTGCLEEEWLQLELNPTTGESQAMTNLVANNCQSIQLADGQTLSFEKVGGHYRFSQYRGNNVVWTKTLLSATVELTSKQIAAHPNGGFYICEPYPARLTRYDQTGAVMYQQIGFAPVNYAAQIGQVLANGDVILHWGHRAARNRRVTVARFTTANGRIDWETTIRTAARINRDTRLAAHLDYPTIAVAHHFVDNEGWEASFLDLRSGRLLNSEIIFSYAERSIVPSVVPNKGIFLTESYSISNQLINNYITLHRYNETGNLFWRKPLLDSQLGQLRSVGQVQTLANNDLLLSGIRNDSLWLLRLNPTGDLSETINGNIDAPDLVLKISASRPDLPLYDFLTFTLIVRNEGGIAAEKIRINAPFIDYQTLAATGLESVTHGVFYNWTGDWDIERLEPGEEAILEIQTFVLSAQPTFRYFSVFQQTPADFNNANNSIVLNLPYTGILTGDTENLVETNPSGRNFSAQAIGNQVRLHFINSINTHTEIALFNLQGQLLQTKKVALYSGVQQVELEVANLPTGVYVVRRLDTGESRKVFF